MFDPTSVVTGRPFRVTLGLRPLALADWLEVDDDRPRDLAAKSRLLAERHADVVAHLPEGDAASAELLDLVVAHLEGWRGRVVGARYHRDLEPVPAHRCHPIDAAGRLVSDDLCLLTRSPDGWRLVAASVCFPSRWRMADKIGRTVAEIHEPVPGYESIAAPTDAAFERLAVERPMWRTNWSILPTAQLFQDGTEQLRDMPPPDQLRLRVERQTLRRLPETGAIVFTIRTRQISLAELVGTRPAAAADLTATLRTVPPATIRYKGWARLMGPMLDWLASNPRPAAGVS